MLNYNIFDTLKLIAGPPKLASQIDDLFLPFLSGIHQLSFRIEDIEIQDDKVIMSSHMMSH